MQVANIIRASAQIVNITELQKGNVIKLVEESSYGGDASLRFAIVNDILSDGDKSYVELFMYKKSYSTAEIETKLLSAAAEKFPAIFPATKDELQNHFNEVKQSILDRIADKEEEIAKQRHLFSQVERLLTIDVDKLSEPKHTIVEAPQLQ